MLARKSGGTRTSASLMTRRSCLARRSSSTSLETFAFAPGRRAADDELGVAGRELLQELADDPANRVVGCRHAEEDLHRAGVLLREPASQAVLRGRVAPFERLEQGDGGLRVEG